MFDKACTYLDKRGISLSRADIATIAELTQQRKYPKNTIVMEQGKVVRKLFFLNEGIVRLFRVHQGTDYTLGFVTKNDFISTPLYLMNGVPSSCALEALTEIDVLEWTKENASAIKAKVARSDEIEQAIMHRLLTWLQDMQIDSICLTAEERYEKFMKEHPDLLQSIPLKYIASYFAIHQDSLSRIRKNIGLRSDRIF